MILTHRSHLILTAAIALFLTSACGESSKNDEDPDLGSGGNKGGDGDGDNSSSGGKSTDSGGSNAGSGGDETSASGGTETSSGGAGDSGGAGENCELIATEPTAPQSARSFGFSGTDEQYAELYDQPCTIDTDCLAPCTERGGSEEFCSTSVCVHSDTDYCLPPIKWRMVESALDQSQSLDEAAICYLWLDDGPNFDQLVLTDFGFDIPSDAVISGITLSIRHAATDLDAVSDQTVELVHAGTGESDNLAQADYWPTELTGAEYGGPNQLWGEEWTPELVNASDFGVAITALPAVDGGSAYVDIAYVQVHYQLPCE